MSQWYIGNFKYAQIRKDKEIKTRKDYGFIYDIKPKCDSRSVFAHIVNFEQEYKIGDNEIVLFQVIPTERGLKAINIFPVFVDFENFYNNFYNNEEVCQLVIEYKTRDIVKIVYEQNKKNVERVNSKFALVLLNNLKNEDAFYKPKAIRLLASLVTDKGKVSETLYYLLDHYYKKYPFKREFLNYYIHIYIDYNIEAGYELKKSLLEEGVFKSVEEIKNVLSILFKNIRDRQLVTKKQIGFMLQQDSIDLKKYYYECEKLLSFNINDFYDIIIISQGLDDFPTDGLMILRKIQNSTIATPAKKLSSVLNIIPDRNRQIEFLNYYIENYLYMNLKLYQSGKEGISAVIKKYGLKLDKYYLNPRFKQPYVSAKNDDEVYHLTSIENLQSIFKNGLRSRKYILENKLKFVDVADQKIISQRQVYAYFGNQKIDLDEFIPFHFHTKSAFDYVALEHGSDNMIYLALNREVYKEKNWFAAVIPTHPLSNGLNKLYDYEEGINLVIWRAIDRRDTYANINRWDPDRELRMAEYLIKEPQEGVPLEVFSAIYVKNYKIGHLLLKAARDGKERSLLEKLIVVNPDIFSRN